MTCVERGEGKKHFVKFDHLKKINVEGKELKGRRGGREGLEIGFIRFYSSK